jgi:restriction endonuclease S subunit
MKIYKNNVISITKSSTVRMGIAFAKEKEALFLKKYFDNCVFRVKDVCYVSKGTAITEKEVCEGKIPVVAGGKDAAYYHNCSNREARVITVSASGASAGYVNYWSVPIWASDCTTIQSSNEEQYLTKFVYYLLKLIQSDMFLLQKGPDQPHVYPDDIAHLMLPNIDIEDQKKFIDKAEIIEKKIEKLQSEGNFNVQAIIDEVFRMKFLFNYGEFKRLKRKKSMVVHKKNFRTTQI